MSLAVGVMSGAITAGGVSLGIVGSEWSRVALGLELGLRFGLLRGVGLGLGVGVAGAGVSVGAYTTMGVDIGLIEGGLRGVGLLGSHAGLMGRAVGIGLGGLVFTLGGESPVLGVGTFTGVGLVFSGRLADDLRLGLRGVGLVGGGVDQLAEGFGLGLTGYFGLGVMQGVVSGAGSVAPMSVGLRLGVVG